jgi:putative glutamine amidotransferase
VLRPTLVAVTATARPTDGQLRVRLNDAYVRSLEGAGLVPLIVPPMRDAARIDALLDVVSGLVLTGGEDVDPARYRSERHPSVESVHPERDATEIALALGARERLLPTLAICRGAQLLNVALGGTLVQDIPSQHPGPLDHDPPAPRGARVHDISVHPDARLARALGAERLRVNSMHHQAVDRLGDGLLAVAHAADGIVEGIEVADPAWWALGVQWHPEELTASEDAWDRRLFAAFAGAAAAGAAADAAPAPVPR